MALNDIAVSDGIALSVDLAILLLVVSINYSHGNSLGKCKKIEISQEALNHWRYFLYAAVFAAWISAYLTFIVPTTFRFVLHGFFTIAVSYNLMVSIPAYICKRMGFGGTCNCDFYKYTDFYPMVILGIVGSLLFLFLDLDIILGTSLLVFLILIAIVFHYFLPEKELEYLKYPPSLLLDNIDNLQAFLMTNPHSKKLITIVDAKCDFCEIQVNEILRTEDNLLENGLRIYDLTFKEQIDPIINMTLNLDIAEEIPVPTTIVFDAGMAVEQKDGVLSRDEIEMLLIH